MAIKMQEGIAKTSHNKPYDKLSALSLSKCNEYKNKCENIFHGAVLSTCEAASHNFGTSPLTTGPHSQMSYYTLYSLCL